MIAAFNGFFRNDEPTGIGYVSCAASRAEVSQVEALLATVMSDGIPTYDKIYAKDHSFVSEALDQLILAGKLPKGTLSEGVKVMLLTNIAWLELRGHLKPDEFNGTQIIEVPDDTSDDHLKAYADFYRNYATAVGRLTVPDGQHRVISLADYRGKTKAI